MVAAHDAQLMLADSFLAERVGGSAVVRAIDRHIARFTAGLRRLRVAPVADAFFDEAVESISEYVLTHGDAFPRFECWSSLTEPRLSVALRPAPPRTAEVHFVPVVTPVTDDSASLKGPHIDRYAGLTALHGSEVLLTTADGVAIEGTTTSLMWWEGDTLTTVAPGPRRVTSITESLVQDIARKLGYATKTAHRSVDEIMTTELWAVNALHGIRAASPHRSERLATFTERYVASARQLAHHSAGRCEISQ